MSAFTKPPNDQGNAPGPAQKAEGQQPAKPAAPQRHAGPPVVVTRTIDVGGPTPSPAQKARPAAPTLPTLQTPASPPAAAPPARSAGPSPAAPPTQPMVHPQGPRTNTVRMEVPPQSTRPSAPPIAPDEAVTSIADTFEKLLSSDLDKGFEAIERKPGAPPTIEGMEITDLAEVRSLFAQLAANHVRPVRDFLMDLRWGEATIEWIDACEPSLKSLRRAAERIDLTELCEALDAFSAALAAAKTAGSRAIEGDRRAALLAAHDKLAEVMPQAFAVDLDRSQRESAILQSLLLQVPEVRKVTIDKLYAAGLTTLEAMLLANPGDVAATTGIDLGLATRIVGRFRDYHTQVRARVPDATRTPERERIGELAAKLRGENAQYEVVARGWSREDAEKKKELRAARNRTLLDIQVMLARLGEVELLRELEKLPFERKLTKLESFIEEARDKYVTQP